MPEPAAPATRPRAAVLLIGDELLSGKIRDANGHYLATTLRRRGIVLDEMCVVSDDVERIGAALLRLLSQAPIVFTSGGVGPTHDDVTLEAIAAATGRPLVRNEEMAAILESFYGERVVPAALRMADIPEGTQLRALPGWPVLRLDVEPEGSPDHPRGRIHPGSRVYILPGVPPLLRAKVETLESLPNELPSGGAWELLVVHTQLDEASLAEPLATVAEAHPTVAIGSYPRWTRDDDGRRRVHVRVTFESIEPGRVAAARAALAAVVGKDALRDVDAVEDD